MGLPTLEQIFTLVLTYVIPSLCLAIPSFAAAFYTWKIAGRQANILEKKTPSEIGVMEAERMSKLGLSYNGLYKDQRDEIDSLKATLKELRTSFEDTQKVYDEQLRICEVRVSQLEEGCNALCNQVKQLGAVPVFNV